MDVAPERSHAAQAQADQACATVWSLLETLEPRTRGAFMLHALLAEDLPTVARWLGVGLEDCRARVAQARIQLRASLGDLAASNPSLFFPFPGVTMSPRLDYLRQAPQAFKKYLDFNLLAKDRSIEQSLGDLVAIRASQVNGCAFCVDMHVKEATVHGERPLRLHHLAIWRESTLFTPRERAALAWTEVLTRIPEHGIADDLYDHVRTQLTEAELTDLTWLVVAINGWNRVNVAFRNEPGSKDAEYGLDKANLA